MNELINRPPPLNKKELFARMREIIALGETEMPAIPRYKGTGGPGCFLEDLIGLRAGNQDIADIIGWEVKYFTPQTNYITLFHKEPGPTGIIRYMVSRYGWKDAQDRLSFRHTIAGRSDRFIVVDDAGNVIVRPLKGNGPVPIWTHDTILNAANKLICRARKHARKHRLSSRLYAATQRNRAEQIPRVDHDAAAPHLMTVDPNAPATALLLILRVL